MLIVILDVTRSAVPGYTVVSAALKPILFFALALTSVHKMIMFVSRQTKLLFKEFFVAALAVSFSLAGLQVSLPPFPWTEFAVFFYEPAGLVASIEFSVLITLHFLTLVM